MYDLRDLQQKLDTTFVYTTSDSSEALQLAKTISVLHGGRVIETSDPFTLYDAPQMRRQHAHSWVPQRKHAGRKNRARRP